MVRTGIGYDVHRLVAGRKLILGGVDISHESGLDGHSDADVLVHAVCDALLGAAGLGDIGTHFPDADARYKGISSLILLEKAAGLVRSAGYAVVNLDATVVAQRPKIGPYKPAMGRNIARAAGIGPERVNVKATTTEGLGPAGREEGISALCIALIESQGGSQNMADGS